LEYEGIAAGHLLTRAPKRSARCRIVIVLVTVTIINKADRPFPPHLAIPLYYLLTSRSHGDAWKSTLRPRPAWRLGYISTTLLFGTKRRAGRVGAAMASRVEGEGARHLQSLSPGMEGRTLE
jgi:hypothetical protein